MANVHLLPFLNDVYDRQPPRHRFQAETPEEWRAWRSEAYGGLRGLLALDTVEEHRWHDAPPAQVSTHLEGPDYRIERVLLPTLRGVWMPCLVLVPNTPPPYPAVLCLHGHGMSKDILAGVPRDEAERERMELLRGDFAAKFAKAGYLAIAPDAAGFGERVEEASLAQAGNNCQHLCVNALSLGMSLQGIRVWEILRALDYLVCRPDVQPDRIAVAGLSMGCEHAMYVAALDERVQAAVLSCGPRAIIPDAKHISWCACLFSPGIFNEMDWPDITALIAPRPIQLQFGDIDYIPLDLARETHSMLQRVYSLSGAEPEALEYDEFSGAHEFHFEAALPFVSRWTGARELAGAGGR